MLVKLYLTQVKAFLQPINYLLNYTNIICMFVKGYHGMEHESLNGIAC